MTSSRINWNIYLKSSSQFEVTGWGLTSENCQPTYITAEVHNELIMFPGRADDWRNILLSSVLHIKSQRRDIHFITIYIIQKVPTGKIFGVYNRPAQMAILKA